MVTDSGGTGTVRGSGAIANRYAMRTLRDIGALSDRNSGSTDTVNVVVISDQYRSGTVIV
ncbi:hypothetical protein D9M68_385370 [compost metagenome]